MALLQTPLGELATLPERMKIRMMQRK